METSLACLYSLKCKNLRTVNMWRCDMKHLFQQFYVTLKCEEKKTRTHTHNTTSIQNALCVLYFVSFSRFLASHTYVKRHMTLFDFTDENIICIYTTNSGNRKMNEKIAQKTRINASPGHIFIYQKVVNEYKSKKFNNVCWNTYKVKAIINMALVARVMQSNF